MATAGWYPDPSGLPGRFRYWDGTVWGEDTSTTPFGPPPEPAAGQDEPTIVPGPGDGVEPPALPPTVQPCYGTYGQAAGSRWDLPAAPTYPPSNHSLDHPSYGGAGGGTVVPLVAGGIVLVILLAVGVLLGVRAIDDDDTPREPAAAAASAGDPLASDPSQTPGGTPPTAVACSGGDPSLGKAPVSGSRALGGGVSMAIPPGYDAGKSGDAFAAFTFAGGVTAPSTAIEEGWASLYAVGSLSRADGFDSPAQAAELVETCMISSPLFYVDPTGVTRLAAEQVTVDGAEAFSLSTEVRVDDPGLAVEGDVVRIVVVDVGDPDRLAVFVSVVPIGDDARLAQQQQVASDLRLS